MVCWKKPPAVEKRGRIPTAVVTTPRPPTRPAGKPANNAQPRSDAEQHEEADAQGRARLGCEPERSETGRRAPFSNQLRSAKEPSARRMHAATHDLFALMPL